MKKQIVTLALLCLSFAELHAQCTVQLNANKKTICVNQSAILNADFNEITTLKDTSVRKRIVSMADMKEMQNVKPMINSGLLTGFSLPIPSLTGSIELDYAPAKLQKTMISSGVMVVTILTDFIQDNKIVIEFPYISKNNKSLKDSILIDGTKLTVGQNSITKTIDLTGTMIDFSAGEPLRYNTLMYKVNSTSRISTKIYAGNETVDMDIMLKDIKYTTNTSFTWFKDGVILEDKNTSSIEVNTPGVYRVEAKLNCGFAKSEITLGLNTDLKVSISTQGNTSFCIGDSVELITNAGTNLAVQWYADDKPVNSATKSKYTARASGSYTLYVSDGVCQAISNKITITTNPIPTVDILNLNAFILKNEGPIYLTATPTGGKFSGQGMDGSIFYPAKVTLGKKSITYTYTSSQGCTNKVTKNTLIVDSTGNVCTKYDTIVVNQTKYDTITVTKNVTKYDTVVINKTKYDTITIKNNVYDTVVINKTKYDTVNILKIKFQLTTGIKANQMTSMSIYPNPTSDVLIIDASDLAAVTGYSYRILDALGKEVYNALVTTTKTEISLKTLGAKGMYVLHILDANKLSVQTKQIILE